MKELDFCLISGAIITQKMRSLCFLVIQTLKMVHEAAEKCQKKVSNSIFPKKDLFRKMGRGGGVFNIALVPLQDGQLAVDLAIWQGPVSKGK